MNNLLSRWRYELLAIVVAVFCIAVHALVSETPPMGLEKGGGNSSPLMRAVQQLEGRATDFKFRLRGPISPSPDVVVVAIDEKSAQKYGLYPWPRERMASAIERLLEAQVAAVGLDIAFTDETADASAVYRDVLAKLDAAAPGSTELEALREELRRRSEQSGDLALEQAFVKGQGKVVQGVFAFIEDDLKDFAKPKVAEFAEVLAPQIISTVPGPGGTVAQLPVEKIEAYSQYAAQTPLKRFAPKGTLLGHVNFVPDVDGTIRRTPSLMKLHGPKAFLASMPLRTVAAYLNATIVPKWSPDSFEATGVELKAQGGKSTLVPYQSGAPFALINFVGPSSMFRTISIADVIEGTVEPSTLKGKVVLIGSTLVGSTGDQRVTPYKELEPGVYSHASVVSNVLTGEFLTRPSYLLGVESLAMLLFSLLLALAMPRLQSFAFKGLLFAVACGVWLTVDAVAFNSGIQMATVMPLASILMTSFGLVFLGYLSVDREKVKMRGTFSRYLGEDVMEEAIKNPEKLNRGEKREMTVLFSDIRGFTTLSERMLPEKLASFINEYLSPMTRIVFDEKGTLDKYIGDAVMAFWNAPLEQTDHALRACRAAVRMLEELERLKVKWRAENYPEFDIGIGINTGPMIVGNMGSDVRVDYTIMGDAVNLGSRLEGTNKEYETRVIFGEGTYPAVKDDVVCRRLGAVRVKGKRKPVRIYELRGMGKPLGDEAVAITAFEAGLDAYVDQKWGEAENHFKEVLTKWPNDAPTRRYLEEIAELRANPPGAGWDGVYTATSK